MRQLAALGLVVLLAGCGGTAERAKPKEPRLQRDVAQSWAEQADQIAAALALGDGCTAQQLAVSLHGQFVSAVNEHRVPPRLQEQLGSALNDLTSRIACVPVSAGDGEHNKKQKKQKKHKKHKNDHGDHHDEGGD